MILKEISNLVEQKKVDEAEKIHRSVSKVKLFFQFLIFLPHLIIAIPMILFQIIRGILYVRKKMDTYEEEIETIENNLDASYDDVSIVLVDYDYDKGFAHFRLNRDAFVLWVHNLKSQLELDDNPDDNFEKTNWHLHSDFISPNLPIEITFYPDTGKLTVDEDYNLFGSPYYFKKLMSEFELVLSRSESTYIVLDSSDTEMINEKSTGRIIFEIQF